MAPQEALPDIKTRRYVVKRKGRLSGLVCGCVEEETEKQKKQNSA